ncbi:MAG: hypothetical protein DHS20C16_04050 [Phycisphaerae bacterium]|nr:MAG: hypothetical protein DHS20C16_04050 [Phycisphaerae bacterium]
MDPAQIRAEFAELMDQCANTVTMEHGLDLDDVLMERIARVGELGGMLDAVESNRFEVPVPFLTDQSSLIQSIQESRPTEQNEAPSPDRLTIEELVVRVYLETGAPLFNQAGNEMNQNTPDPSNKADSGR